MFSKINFESTPSLNYERGTSRAENSKSNDSNTKKYFRLQYLIIKYLEVTLLKFKKAVNTYFYFVCYLWYYITLAVALKVSYICKNSKIYKILFFSDISVKTLGLGLNLRVVYDVFLGIPWIYGKNRNTDSLETFSRFKNLAMTFPLDLHWPLLYP